MKKMIAFIFLGIFGLSGLSNAAQHPREIIILTDARMQPQIKAVAHIVRAVHDAENKKKKQAQKVKQLVLKAHSRVARIKHKILIARMKKRVLKLERQEAERDSSGLSSPLALEPLSPDSEIIDSQEKENLKALIINLAVEERNIKTHIKEHFGHRSLFDIPNELLQKWEFTFRTQHAINTILQEDRTPEAQAVIDANGDACEELYQEIFNK